MQQNETNNLPFCKILQKQQAAYSVFVSRFKDNKLLHESHSKHPPLTITSVTGSQIYDDKEILHISLPTRCGELLVIPILHETAEIEFMNSSKITSELHTTLIKQSLEYSIYIRR